jgi:hypothetical protein
MALISFALPQTVKSSTNPLMGGLAEGDAPGKALFPFDQQRNRRQLLATRGRSRLRLSSSLIPTMGKGVSTGELLNRFSVGFSLLGHRDIPHSDYYEWCSGFGSMLLGNCRKTGLWVN